MDYLKILLFVLTLSSTVILTMSNILEAKPTLDDLNSCKEIYSNSGRNNGDLSCLFNIVGGLLGEDSPVGPKNTYAKMTSYKYVNSHSVSLDLMISTSSDDQIQSVIAVFTDHFNDEKVISFERRENCEHRPGRRCKAIFVDGLTPADMLEEDSMITILLINKDLSTVTVTQRGYALSAEEGGIYRLKLK